MRVAESSPVTKGVLTHGTNALKDENLSNAIAIETRHELEKKYSWAVLKPRAQQIIIKRKL